ncbi:MAG: 30S ribosomal protein S8 [Candidatus Pacebacteria bacterium]|nr:30S ribosomal protein S8 [Candidatus Paceibacterota bacterium]
MVGDPIGDMLNRIKTAGAIGSDTISVPFSNLKFAVAKVLEKQGYVAAVEKKGKKVTKTIEIDLAYTNDELKIKGVERVSKPSCRVYFGVRDIKLIRNGYGAIILSTPKGIMTGRDARKEQVGGEVLFKIW